MFIFVCEENHFEQHTYIYSDKGEKLMNKETIHKFYELMFEGTEYNEHFYILSKSQNYDKARKVTRCNPNTFISDIRANKVSKTWNTYAYTQPLRREALTDRELNSMLERGLDIQHKTAGKTQRSKFKQMTAASAKNVFSFRNIVLKLDWSEKTYKEIESYKAELNNHFEDLFLELPKPNIVEFTEDECCFIYCIEECSLELKWLVNKMIDKLTQKMNDRIIELDLFNGITIYKSKSKKLLQLVRIPGAPCTVKGSSLDLEIIYDKKYTIDDLKDEMGVIGTRRMCSDGVYRVHGKKNNLRNLGKRRLRMIESLISCRSVDKNKKLALMYLFLYYNNLVHVVNSRKAKYLTYRFIEKYMKSFYLPTLEEINDVFINVDRVFSYDYTNAKLIETLDISEEECMVLNFNVEGSKLETWEKEKLRVASKKEARDIRIINAYVESGSFVEAAKAGHVCLNTAKKVVSIEKAELVARLKAKKRLTRDRLIFSHFIEYRNIKGENKAKKDAAKNVGCSYKTAKFVIKKYLALRHYIHMLFIDRMIWVNDYVWINKEYNYGQFCLKDYFEVENAVVEYSDVAREAVNIAYAPYLVIKYRPAMAA